MNINISSISKDPIYEQIVQQIKKSIIVGELSGGEMLPSIRTLAKNLRISVITTKRAYDELEHEEYIYTLPGKGSYVRECSTNQIREQMKADIENLLRNVKKTATLCGLNKEQILKIYEEC